MHRRPSQMVTATLWLDCCRRQGLAESLQFQGQQVETLANSPRQRAAKMKTSRNQTAREV